MIKAAGSIAFVVAMGLAARAPAQFLGELSNQPTISVSGTAEVKVAPDEIHLDVGVETRHPSLDEAKSENDQHIAAVLAFLKAAGIDRKDIQTDFIAVHPHYRTDSETSPDYYVAQRSVGIRLRKVPDFEKVLTGVLKHGANHVHGIDFRTTELRKHRDTARQLAIRAAKEKAEALAGELGTTVGKVQRISENTWGGSWSWSGGHWGSRHYGGYAQNVSQNAGGGAPSEDGSLSVGQISVSATVTVSFLIE